MLTGAIDGGGTKILTGVVADDGTVVARREEQVTSREIPAYFARCAAMLRACVAEAGTTLEGLRGVGMSVPGMTDGLGYVFGSPSAGWGPFSALEQLQPLLGLPEERIRFENDINACALAELRWGGGGKDFVWLTISTGNGGAVVANGQLVRGHRFCAGELGHLKVEFDRPARCGCGALGCLEAHASGPAIARMAREAGLDLDAAALAALARQGDAAAQGIFDRAGCYLGRALAQVANLLNFEKAYLGGGVSRSLDLLMPALRAEFDRLVLPQCRDVVIERTRLGYEASLLGAASLVG
ncbi:MAG: ROK family protein [Kiritimatiellae bacterium]|nr:ROK family protein [Kiritimatiellia bacterium]